MDNRKSLIELKTEFHKKYIKTKEFEEVRNAVFKRDNYKCILCGRTENLVCHHTSYRHLGYHNEKEIADCVTLCLADHLNHHKGKYNLWWYSVDHPRNNDDLRELDVDGHKILIRSNGKDIYDGITYRKFKIIHHKDRDRYTISINQKNHYVSRLVAKAFPEICGEWFEGCEVHHKDRDKSNNSVENLLVMTKEQHMKEHSNENSERLKESNKKTVVYQYSLSGNYIARWNSIVDVSEKLGLNKSAISNCIQGFSESSGGYIWKSFEEDEDIPLWVDPILSFKDRMREKNGVEISQYDKNGNWIKDWRCAADAAEYYGCKSISSINNCLNGRSKSSVGYIWKKKKVQ